MPKFVPPSVDGQIVTGRPAGRDRRAAGDGEAGAKVVILVADGEAARSSPSSHQFMDLMTQPERVTETFLLPLRTVVASSSATRSSRSAQQSPPRSAALAGVALNANPPSVRPSAAAMAMRLDVFVSPPNMSISTFPDKLPKSKLSLRIRLSAPSGRIAHHDQAEIPPNESSEFAYTRSGRKVNCYQSRRGRFWSSCDISATKPAPVSELADAPHHARKLSVVNGLVRGRRTGRSSPENFRRTRVGREQAPLSGTLPNPYAVSAPDLALQFSFWPIRLRRFST